MLRRPKFQIFFLSFNICFFIFLYFSSQKNIFSPSSDGSISGSTTSKGLVPDVTSLNFKDIEVPPGVDLFSLLKDAPGQFIILKTKTVPSYLIAGDPDQAIFDYMKKRKLWSPVMVQIIKEILYDRCDPSLPGSQNPLLVDVGGNLGMETIYFAAFGCRVISYEPVPISYYFMKLSIYLNKLEDRVILYEKAVDKTNGQSVLKIDRDNAVSELVAEINSDNKKVDLISVKTVSLGTEIKEDSLIIKIDVEGFEDNVLEGMKPILSKYNIENIICETKKTRNFEYKIEFIKDMMMKNYIVVSYKEELFTPKGENMQFDLIDCALLQNNITSQQWFLWEDLWFIKIGSKSHVKALKKLKCLSE